MVDVIDDFDSVMSQVMKELEGESAKTAEAASEVAPKEVADKGLVSEMFNDVVEYKDKEKLKENDVQDAADTLLEIRESVEPKGLFNKKTENDVVASQPVTTGKNGSGSFSIDLEGIIGVDLKLKFGEKELFITCDDEQLIIRLGDGSTFNIPFKGKIEKAA